MKILKCYKWLLRVATNLKVKSVALFAMVLTASYRAVPRYVRHGVTRSINF